MRSDLWIPLLLSVGACWLLVWVYCAWRFGWRNTLFWRGATRGSVAATPAPENLPLAEMAKEQWREPQLGDLSAASIGELNDPNLTADVLNVTDAANSLDSLDSITALDHAAVPAMPTAPANSPYQAVLYFANERSVDQIALRALFATNTAVSIETTASYTAARLNMLNRNGITDERGLVAFAQSMQSFAGQHCLRVLSLPDYESIDYDVDKWAAQCQANADPLLYAMQPHDNSIELCLVSTAAQHINLSNTLIASHFVRVDKHWFLQDDLLQDEQFALSPWVNDALLAHQCTALRAVIDIPRYSEACTQKIIFKLRAIAVNSGCVLCDSTLEAISDADLSQMLPHAKQVIQSMNAAGFVVGSVLNKAIFSPPYNPSQRHAHL